MKPGERLEIGDWGRLERALVANIGKPAAASGDAAYNTANSSPADHVP